MFVVAKFNELVSSSNLSPHLHVILHAMLVRSCRIHCSISVGKLSPSGEDAYQTNEGCEKVFLFGPHLLSATVTLLPEGEGYFLDDGFCDFAFGSAQNDRVVCGAAKSQSFRTSETNQKEV